MLDSYFFNSWMTLYWMTRLLNCMALLDEREHLWLHGEAFGICQVCQGSFGRLPLQI